MDYMEREVNAVLESLCAMPVSSMSDDANTSDVVNPEDFGLNLSSFDSESVEVLCQATEILHKNGTVTDDEMDALLEGKNLNVVQSSNRRVDVEVACNNYKLMHPESPNAKYPISHAVNAMRMSLIVGYSA